jgi:hypothetical protein
MERMLLLLPIATPAIKEIIPIPQIPVLAVTRMTIAELQIQITRLPDSRPIVRNAIPKLRGNLPLSTMTECIFQFIAGSTEMNGVRVRIAIKTRQIIRHLHVLRVMSIVTKMM